jgi:cytochrome c oxidase assembly protein subunit 15
VTGVLPPIGDAAWNDAFAHYKATPEYSAVNAGMDLAAFKSIYLVEWGHRLLGRVAGLLFGVPLVVFVAKRRLRGARLVRLFAVFGLGGLQGAVGWWMVKSGLVDVPRVSPYRLAAHLLFAVALLGLLVWHAYDEIEPHEHPQPLGAGLGVARWLTRATIAAIVVTLTWGALMAGLHAGHVAPSFPTMNGEWIPAGMGGYERDVFENPMTVHFVHRMLAYVTATLAIVTAGIAWRSTRDALARRRAIALVLLVLAQIALGALTVLRHVRIDLASTHQVNAVLVLACAVMLLHRLRVRVPVDP